MVKYLDITKLLIQAGYGKRELLTGPTIGRTLYVASSPSGVYPSHLVIHCKKYHLITRSCWKALLKDYVRWVLLLNVGTPESIVNNWIVLYGADAKTTAEYNNVIRGLVANFKSRTRWQRLKDWFEVRLKT